MMTDPIADMLTRIRNANRVYHESTDIPYSKIKESIAKKLKQEGFIKDYKIIEASPVNIIRIYLKYGPKGERVIREIKRVSKPGRRVYKKVKEMKKVLGGLGIMIVSTPKGILTDKECREQKVGGEILCCVY